jgi:NADPH:quinone reductase-like Zn-dependent oxidoreductase
VNLILRQLFSREISLHGSMLGTVDELKKITTMISNGKFKPVVDTVFDLSEARAAHEAMQSKNRIGKLVLKVAD